MGLRSVVFNAGGREIYDRDIEGIQEVTRVCGGLSRKELAHTVCDHLSWVTASGRHKIDACMKLLKKLEAMGTIVLPAKQEHKPPPRIIISPKSRTAPRAAVCGELSDVGGDADDSIRHRRQGSVERVCGPLPHARIQAAVRVPDTVLHSVPQGGVGLHPAGRGG